MNFSKERDFEKNIDFFIKNWDGSNLSQNVIFFILYAQDLMKKKKVRDFSGERGGFLWKKKKFFRDFFDKNRGF